MILLLGVILGILLIILAIPILETLRDLICAWLDLCRAFALLNVAKVNCKIEKMSDELDKSNQTYAIGFKNEAPEFVIIPDEDDDDEDIEDTKSLMVKREIGFKTREKLD